MRFISSLLSLSILASSSLGLPFENQDASSLSFLEKLRRGLSGRAGDSDDKYFHESSFHPHYDGRFSDHALGYEEQNEALRNLVQTYLATFNDLGIETWLMHGSLMGWWWNKKTLPWDSDIDVQVTEPTMYYLAAYFNMSTFFVRTPTFPRGRRYLLEVNPHYINREQTDKLNTIDARWIDISTGLFIDITAARYNLTHPRGEGMMSCKDGHEFRDTYVFPLRSTYFEGMPAKIPYRYREFLVAEYGQEALENTEYHDHHFDGEKMEWIPRHRISSSRKGDLQASGPELTAMSERVLSNRENT